MEWTKGTILRFIRLIRERPAIWDAQSPEHKIKQKRHIAVEEVALLLGITIEEVNTKWNILRNQYSREKRKMIGMLTRNGAIYKTKWFAYKEMGPLMPSTSEVRRENSDANAKTLRLMRQKNNERHLNTDDDLISYGLYIAAHLRKFPPRLQCKAKFEINNILYTLDMENLGESPRASVSSIDDNYAYSPGSHQGSSTNEQKTEQANFIFVNET